MQPGFAPVPSSKTHRSGDRRRPNLEQHINKLSQSVTC
jgi:hypothetical protein